MEACPFGVTVLITACIESGAVRVATSYKAVDDAHNFYFCGYGAAEVTHWMPLPEGPK